MKTTRTIKTPLKLFIFLLAISALAPMAGAAPTTYTKGNNTLSLSTNGSWTTTGFPNNITTDIALWDNTVTAANTVSLGGDLAWLGMQITSPNGTVTIQGANTLTLGASGIDASTSTQSLSLKSFVILNAVQTWSFNATVFHNFGVAGSTIDNGGNTLTINNGSVQISGNLIGAGGLTKEGSGALTITGNATYSGTTTLNGTLAIGNGGATGSIASSSLVTSSSSGTLQFFRSTDFTFANTIAGSVLVQKYGAGTTTVTATNTYTGGTEVRVGTLLVSNPVSGSDSATGTGMVYVYNNATLGGTGQITPGGAVVVTVASGGTIAPGAAGIGTLTINGANTSGHVLTLISGAKFAFELNSGFQSDVLALLNGASGDIQFSGNAINFSDLSGGSLASGVYTLFTATAPDNYGGTFAVDGSGFVTAGLSIGTGLGAYTGSTLQLVGNNIVLNVVPEPAVWVLLAGAGTFFVVLRRRSTKV